LLSLRSTLGVLLCSMVLALLALAIGYLVEERLIVVLLSSLGVQLSYRFVLFYGHRLIFLPPHPARGFIRLGGVRGHPGDPTSWVSLGAALRASQGNSPLRGHAFKD